MCVVVGGIGGWYCVWLWCVWWCFVGFDGMEWVVVVLGGGFRCCVGVVGRFLVRRGEDGVYGCICWVDVVSVFVVEVVGVLVMLVGVNVMWCSSGLICSVYLLFSSM